MKRFASAVLSAMLALSATMALPFESDAAVPDSDLSTTKGLVYTIYRNPDIVYYDDGLFKGDSYDFNRRLAALSYAACASSFNAWQAGYGDTENCRNLKCFMEDNGFVDFAVNEAYEQEATLEKFAVACAHKKLSDNGKEYTLLAVFPRSGTFGIEYYRSLILSDNEDDKGDHAGYEKCKDIVVDYVKDYIDRFNIEGDVKVWTSSYSGGGCVDNLFAAELLRDPAKILGKNISFKNKDFYCYNFSPMRAASVHGDWQDSRFDYIHVVYEKADFLASIPTPDQFTRYGREYFYYELGDKDKMLSHLKADSSKNYESYINSADPDLFGTFRLDAEALLSGGGLEFAADDDSYLPDNQTDYVRSVSETIEELCAEAGDGDSRAGFCRAYQDSMCAFMYYLLGDGTGGSHINVVLKALTGTDTSIPMMLSMYSSFLLNKRMNDKSADVNSAIEDAFNMIAAAVEDENGSLRQEYSYLKAYELIKHLMFTEKTDEDGTGYKLVRRLNRADCSLLLKNMKKLSADLYAASMKTALTEAEEDQKWFDLLTGEETCRNTSWFIANLLFGNSEQSRSFEPLSFDNEQFKQMATLNSNLYRLTTPHMYTNINEWLKSADDYYDDYCRADDAQLAGCRRLFIDAPSGSSVAGTVYDENGMAAASFRDGKLTGRSDEWIGITSCDTGSWLRLPCDKDYRVELSVSRDTSVNIRIDDYSPVKRRVERSVDSDKTYNWNGLELRASDDAALSIPAAERNEEGYDLTGAYYSLSIKGSASGDNTGIESTVSAAPSPANNGMPEKYSKRIPKAKNVKTKAAKRSFTVKWKKLSAKQRKKFGKTEIQYSTDKSFPAAKTKVKEVGKSKNSCRIKKLKKGRVYYVRVRNIKYAHNTKYVSKWSAVRKVKVK